ncbi:hypothetical protein E2C01_075532 [Portunus trituberculatus]|uniref:Uncharacterized protein n=1 Tax=Portunus trituberculatus TaxID=210409 RepID=A0A5B7IKE9_PORTR|nr:hypothetical protein [Portunus trituberculatus]
MTAHRRLEAAGMD